MAKFCTKCGKPLVDGQPCECTPRVKVEPVKADIASEETKVEESVAQEEERPEKKIVKKVVKKKVVRKPMNIWEIFVAVLKAPVTSMERVVSEGYFINGMLLCLIECALLSLNICIFISSMLRMTYNGISSLAGSYSGYSSGYSSYINVPYFEIFFKLLIFYVIVKFLFVVISMGLLNGMGKAKISFKAAFPAASGYSTATIVGTVIGIILTFLNPIIGLIVTALTGFLAIIMHTVSITGLKGIRKNACVWISFMTIVFTSLISAFLFAFVSQSFATQLGNSISNSLGSLFY